MKSNKIFRIGAVSGIALSVLFVIVLTIAISLNPWFSFYKNALSDLGSLKVPTKYIFNCGLILMGLSGIVFSLAAVKYFDSAVMHILTIAMIFLIAVGVFPEEYGKIHSIPAILFYLLSLAGIFYAGILFKERKEKMLSLFSMVGSVVTFILVISTLGKVGLAVPEMIGAVFILSWIVAISYKMLKEVKEEIKAHP
ncbi:DUF998 domain-containing protein [Thermococcus sp. M39]|uniref:DUF998 domain-containing protein n=1 Tax=Thermococcus sp. M39 TaxID=1638262 RepID=UPI001438F3A8|nr:DUF998 domain-containing protein [Thermococcus sp. M39]NJE08168.1 DUF998 domain-containing protein [Thermococcus sp. M39]